MLKRDELQCRARRRYYCRCQQILVQKLLSQSANRTQVLDLCLYEGFSGRYRFLVELGVADPPLAFRRSRVKLKAAYHHYCRISLHSILRDRFRSWQETLPYRLPRTKFQARRVFGEAQSSHMRWAPLEKQRPKIS